jgi:hypothetical protein
MGAGIRNRICMADKAGTRQYSAGLPWANRAPPAEQSSRKRPIWVEASIFAPHARRREALPLTAPVVPETLGDFATSLLVHLRPARNAQTYFASKACKPERLKALLVGHGAPLSIYLSSQLLWLRRNCRCNAKTESSQPSQPFQGFEI